MQRATSRRLLAAAAAAVVTAMLLGYLWTWSWLAAMDSAALEPLHRFGAAHSAWVTFWNLLCTVLSPASFRLLGLAVIAVALVQRNVRAAVFVFATVELSAVVIVTVKYLVGRPRPETALVHAVSSSFPSGHALGVMAGVLGLLAVGLATLAPRLRMWAIVAGAAVVVAVGVGRVVLNVHHPSDVLAGWALGYLWVQLWLMLIRPRPLTRGRHDPPPTARGQGADRVGGAGVQVSPTR